jgi:hypothetical protein
MRHPKCVHVFLAAVLALPLLAAVRSSVVEYVGGTLNIPQGSQGALEVTNTQALLFARGSESYNIPYSAISSMEWGDHVGRRNESVNARMVMAAPFQMWKKRPQYLTLSFREGGDNQVAIFTLTEENLRVLTPALEARTGKKMEYSENIPSAPSAPAQPATVPPATMAAPASPAPASVGSMVDVSFVSKPVGAIVMFYGMPAGKTPLTTKLTPGDYKVTVSAPGMLDWTQEFSVQPAKPVSLLAELKPRPQEQVTENASRIMLPAIPVSDNAPPPAPVKKTTRRKKTTTAANNDAEMPKVIVGHVK